MYKGIIVSNFKMVKIELGKKDSVWVALVVVLIGVGFVFAYGGDNPNVMGHSAGELEIKNTNADTICSGDTFLSGDGACWTADEIVKAGSDGATVIGMDHKECSSGDVYWYDSDGNRGAKAEECGSLSTTTYRDVCYSGECGACRYDSGVICQTGMDGFKLDVNCVDRPRYLWMELAGASIYGNGGTYGYYSDLNSLSDPVFHIGTTEYTVDGRLQWRGNSKGSGWYEVCETDNLVSQSLIFFENYFTLN